MIALDPKRGAAVVLATASAAAACTIEALDAPAPLSASCNPTADQGAHKPTALMDPSPEPFAAPYPALGRPLGFPVSTGLEERLAKLITPDRYALTAGIFFPLSDDLAKDARLPPLFQRPTLATRGDGSVDPASVPSVIVFPVSDPRALAPVNVEALRWARAQGKPMLSVLPVQGVPLAAETDYAAIVTTAIANASADMLRLCGAWSLRAGDATAQAYFRAIDAAATLGLACTDVAAMTVFHTGDPTAETHAVQALARADYATERGTCAVHLEREKDPVFGWRCANASFCVYTGTVWMPQYQRGTPPYFPYVEWQGGWPSEPVPPRATLLGCFAPKNDVAPPAWTPWWREARVVVTVPHAPPPAATHKYPVLALVRTGAGSTTDTLVDRGPLLAPSCAPTACRGPAEVLQSVGFAGLTIDGPLVGTSRKEPLELDEDLGVFDFLNPEALRDNIRQSGIELGLIPTILPRIDLDLSECEGAGPERGALLDGDRLAMFSHSMGSTVAPLALSGTPEIRAAVLSGSGGSLIENVLFKKKPVPINAAAELLGYACAPQRRDPAMSLMQWALEPADSQVYASRMVVDRAAGDTWRAPENARHVLMIQGIIDDYIPAPIANVMTLGEGLDLAVGPGSCSGDPYCDRAPFEGVSPKPFDYPAIADMLFDLERRPWRTLATATGNVPVPAGVTTLPAGFPDRLTAAVVQHRIDENREGSCDVDGHEVAYESTLARHQIACFLDDFAKGKVPSIRASGGELAPCE